MSSEYDAIDHVPGPAGYFIEHQFGSTSKHRNALVHLPSCGGLTCLGVRGRGLVVVPCIHDDYGLFIREIKFLKYSSHP